MSNQFSCKFLIKKNPGVTASGITNQSVQSPKPRAQLNPYWLLPGSHDPADKTSIQLAPHMCLPASLFVCFLHKLQSIHHFLWTPAPAQICLPGREIFVDIQMNSLPFISSHLTEPSRKLQMHLNLPSAGPVGTSCWAQSRLTTDAPSIPSFSLTPIISSVHLPSRQTWLTKPDKEKTLSPSAPSPTSLPRKYPSLGTIHTPAELLVHLLFLENIKEQCGY